MAAMGRLPDEQREVVALILVEGFGYREAAELLGLPIGTVSSRLVRGRTALLEMVGER
jgi:RNA polymerase sigma-70 factor (ECF subfamily)